MLGLWGQYCDVETLKCQYIYYIYIDCKIYMLNSEESSNQIGRLCEVIRLLLAAKSLRNVMENLLFTQTIIIC